MEYRTRAATSPTGRYSFLGPDLGLQRRIMLYVALGSVAGLIFFGIVAQRSLQESTQIILAERLLLTRLVAHELAGELEADAQGNLHVPSPDRVQAILTRYSMEPIEGEPMFHLSLLDRGGNLLVENYPVPNANPDEHKELLHNYLVQGIPGVEFHVPRKAPEKVHVVAYAPLPGRPGGVTLEQGQDAVVAVPRSLQRHMGGAGVLFIATGLLLAWLTTRQVTRPLSKLTDITRSIAGGDLSTPVPQDGKDEVRELAASFEAMRRQLRESHAELARANRELEQRVQERTRELEVRHAELARASRLLQRREAERTFLLERTIQAQEEERRRVARELHDAVGQFLSWLVMRLSLVETQAQGVEPRLAEGLGELRRQTSQAVKEVRRLVVDLRPELLDDLGLPAALSHFTDQMLGKEGIDATLDLESVARLPSQVEVVVFRVMQEAVTNVVKHARASRVEISLRWEGNDLVGEVLDNGIGFVAPAAYSLNTGVGLLGMRERVALLGGSLQVKSAPGLGTHLSFRVPLERGNQGEADSSSAG